MKKFFLLLAILTAAFFLFTFRNTQVPPGINGDEAGIGHNALLISRNLTDENGNFLPLFIFAKGSDWKQPVTVYATALIFKLFGASFFTLRAASVFFILLAIVILYLISKEYGGDSFFAAVSIIFLLSPIVIIQSHLALENIAPLPFVLFWLFALLKFEKNRRLGLVFLAGASLGAGIFSYLGMRLMVPVLVVLTIFYLAKNLKASAVFLIGLTPFLALLAIGYLRYPGAVFGSFEAPLPSVYEFLHRYLAIFDLSFLFFTGDKTAYHSTGNFGVLLLPTLPLFILGAYKIVRAKRPLHLLTLAAFFLAPLLYGLVPEFYRASRLLAILPFYAIISAIGLLAMHRIFIFGSLILLAVSYYAFVYDYWYEYPTRVQEVFSIPFERTYEFRVK